MYLKSIANPIQSIVIQSIAMLKLVTSIEIQICEEDGII